MADKTEFEAEMASEMARSRSSVTDELGAFAVVPHDYSVVSLEKYQARPNRVVQDVVFRDAKSLAVYLNRFETGERILFSSPDTCTIKAVIDYHTAQDQPSHCDHKASFNANFDSHYAVWRGAHGKSMSQKEVGEFLEEHALDIVDPDAASVMEIVMNFEAIRRVTFKQSMRLNSGTRQFTYVEDDDVKGAITMPEKISISVPVFEGQEAENIPVRVKYRLNDGKLTFSFEIHNKPDVERAAFDKCEASLVADLKVKTDIMRVA